MNWEEIFLFAAMVIHAVAKKWKISNTLYVVVALKRENTYSGWLSSLQILRMGGGVLPRHDKGLDDALPCKTRGFFKRKGVPEP